MNLGAKHGFSIMSDNTKYQIEGMRVQDLAFILSFMPILATFLGSCRESRGGDINKSDSTYVEEEVRSVTPISGDSAKGRDSALKRCMEVYYLSFENQKCLTAYNREFVRNPFGLSPFCLRSFFERYSALLKGATIREVLLRHPIYDIEGRELDDSCSYKVLYIEHDYYTMSLLECESRCYPKDITRLAEYVYQEPPDTFYFHSMQLRDPRFYLADSIHVGMSRSVLYGKLTQIATFKNL